MTKASEFKDKSIEELEMACIDSRRELFHLRNGMKRDKKSEKPHLLRLKRKQIAQILTILHQKKSGLEQTAR